MAPNSEQSYSNEPRNNWARDEVDTLFSLPFADLTFAAQTVHRQNFDANEVQMSATVFHQRRGAARKIVVTVINRPVSIRASKPPN